MFYTGVSAQGGIRVAYIPTAGTSVAVAADVLTTANQLPADGWCYAYTARFPDNGLWLHLAAVALNTSLTVNASQLFTDSAATAPRLDVWDAVGGQSVRQSGVNLSGSADVRICGCASAGALAIYRNGVLETGTSTSGTGTGIIVSAPTTVRIGSYSPSIVGGTGFRNFAFGLTNAVCQ